MLVERLELSLRRLALRRGLAAEHGHGLAAPALGRVAVSFNQPHRLDVRNHGTALECLISGLIIELARAGARSHDPTHRQQIDVFADVGRGTPVLEIESSGQDYYAHKTGFTQKSLLNALHRSGYTAVYSAVGNLEVNAIAFKGTPDPANCALFGLPTHQPLA